jgi:PhoPQ-activated pathogenicity-related protein
MLTRTAALGLALLVAAPARADLAGYVARPEPAYAWTLKGKSSTPLGTVYDLHVVSQTWQGINWEHSLQVYVPLGVTPTATMFLWNQGGNPSGGSTAFGLTLASKIKAPVAFLFGIPNQPLLGGLREDALIAETFVRCLDTGDENWPLLFPMTKSLVKAMDALQAFSEQEWQSKVTGFVVSGASKRGWTAWLTAASDSRVKAVAPMVIDMLNLPEQLPHQVKTLGKYSEMIHDYTERKLVPLPDTALARKLWQMTDPFSYRDRLTQPKLILNGANDRYWATDALNLYWDGLQGDKWVLYVPNAGHGLDQKTPQGKRDHSRLVDAVTAFARSQVHGTPLPRLSWKYDEAGDKLRMTVTASPTPKATRLWVADAPTRDFRAATWADRPVAEGGLTAEVERPAQGFRAFFAELDFDDGQPFRLSTQMRVFGN